MVYKWFPVNNLFGGSMNSEVRTAERRTLDLWPETGSILGLSRPSTYAGAKPGDIPTIKIGGAYWFRERPWSDCSTRPLR